MHLVDTNVISELVRSKPDPNVLDWFEKHNSISLSVITVEEIAFGIGRAPSTRRKKLSAWFELLLATTRTIDVTASIARTAGELRAARSSRGRPVASADMLIAATALVHSLDVVTRNVADFAGCGVGLVDPFTR